MSIRREVRLRKDFLFKKQQEVVAVVKTDKKRKIREALESDKAIPTELLAEARQLHHEMQLDLASSSATTAAALDDEYATVGSRDPKVCITSSRDPSSRLKQFVKEMKLCIPNAQNVNRGTSRIDELVDACKKADFTDIVIVSETRGQPDGLIVSHLPFGPTAYFTLSNCVLR